MMDEPRKNLDDPNAIETTGPGVSGVQNVPHDTQVSDEVNRAFAQVDDLTRPAASTQTGGSIDTDPARSAEGNPGGAFVGHPDTATLVDQALDSEAPEAARSAGVRQAVEHFNALAVDDKLAVFYYIYEAMGESVTPAAPGAADPELTHSFFEEFNALPQGDAQLEAMRALVRGDDNALGREYGKQVENNKLYIWLTLAERMGKDVIGMPSEYQLGDIAQQNLVTVKALDFEQQITFMRDIAAPMGCDPIRRAV